MCVTAMCAIGCVVALSAAGQRVIGLGEQMHGSATLNARKAGLLDSLSRVAPIGGIVIESSFVGSVAAFASNADMAERMRQFVYPFWLSDTIVSVFRRVERFHARDSLPFLWGCDVQEDQRFHEHTLGLLRYGLLEPWRQDLLRADSVMERSLERMSRREHMTEAELAATAGLYRRIARALEPLSVDAPINEVLLLCMKNRAWLCDALRDKPTKRRMHERDEIMSQNIAWIRERPSLSGALVFWAADLHVRRAKDKNARPVWCGERLSHMLMDDYRAISVRYKRRGAERFDQASVVRERLQIPDSAWITPRSGPGR